MSRKKNGYQVGTKYAVTEVLSWWLFHQNLRVAPRWLPVMGRLHHDTEFFAVDELHYHVDPRFLDAVQAVEALAQIDIDRQTDASASQWHPAFREVLTHFPLTDADGRSLCFTVTDGSTLVKDLDLRVVSERPTAWGLERVLTRRKNLVCRAEMPRVGAAEPPLNHAFRNLRKKFRNACGDIWPHKGYDLRSIAVDAAGYRQCPLHQLRVKAPAAAEAH